MITSFSLILVNDNFFAFTVSNYRCGYGCIFNVLANFQSVIAYCKYLIKSYGFWRLITLVLIKKNKVT